MIFLCGDIQNLLNKISAELNPRILQMKVIAYIKSDLYRYSGSLSVKAFAYHFIFTKGFNYSFWLRLAQSQIFLLGSIGKFMHFLSSRSLQIYIPVATKIGYGLHLGHGLPLVVNETAVLGNNVNISQFVSIGSNLGRAAIVGDNCYIGPCVCIVEDVVIGSSVIIGAGSVVISNIPCNSTAVGVPARVIPVNRHPEFIQNTWT